MQVRVDDAPQLLAEVVPFVGRQRVVTPVAHQGRFRRRVVGELTVLLARQRRHLQDVAVAEVAAAEEAGMRHVAGVLAIAVGALVEGPRVEREPVGQQPRRVVHRTPPRVPGARAQLHVPTRRRARERQGLEIDRPAVRRRAVGARAHAALDLHRLNVTHDAGHVGEVEHLVLRVVERDAVEREVDPRLVDAAQPDVAVARIAALLGVRRERRRVGQQQRRFLAERPLLDLPAGHDVGRDRRRVAGAQRRHRDALQRLDHRHQVHHQSCIGGDVEFARGISVAGEPQVGRQRDIQSEPAVGARGGRGPSDAGFYPDAGQRGVRVAVADGTANARRRQRQGEQRGDDHTTALRGGMGRVRKRASRRVERMHRLSMGDSLRRYEPVQVRRV